MKTLFNALALFVLLTTPLTINAQKWAWAYSGGLSYGRDIAIDHSGNVFTINNGSGSYGSANITLDASSVLAKHDSTGKLIWAVGMTLPHACALSTDRDGNVYVTSATNGNGTDKLYGITTKTTITHKAGYRDGLVVKYSSAGEILWAVTFGGTNDEDEPRAIKADDFGNTYVTGLSFTHDTSGALIHNYFLKKFDSKGTLLWEDDSEWKHVIFPTGIDLDNANGVYVCGYFLDSAVFNNFLLSSGNVSQSIFVAKYTTGGTLAWAQKKGTNAGFCNAISVDDKKDIYLAGTVLLPNSFDNIPTLIAQTSTLSACMYIAKMDSTANTIWVQTGEKIIPQDIECNANDCFLTGFYTSKATFNSSTPTVVSSAKTNEIFVARYSSSGAFAWVLSPGGKQGQNNFGSGIDCDRQGMPWIVGSITTQTNFDQYYFNVIYTNALVSDQFMAKVDTGSYELTLSEEQLYQSQVSVFPSPSDRYFFVKYENAQIKTAQYSINNVLGEQVQSGTLSLSSGSTLNSIDLFGNPPGIYFVSLKFDQNTVTLKIILQ